MTKWNKRTGRQTIMGGKWNVDEKIYMPNNQKIKEKILQENHNPVDIRHLEQQ